MLIHGKARLALTTSPATVGVHGFRYLVGLEETFKKLGATSTQSARAPLIRVTEPIPAETLMDAIRGSLGDPTLADVRVAAVDPETGAEGSIVAHRLVLGLSSPVFRTMFTAGFAEAQVHYAVGDELPVIQMPEWAHLPAATCLLQYFYSGRPYGDDIGLLHPPDERKCAVVCELLRLADMYQLPHLKQWAEHYLGSPSVLDLCASCLPVPLRAAQ